MFKDRRTYKPYTRMWIYGFNVDKEYIDLNLNEIKNAGIGGVEIQVLYPVAIKGNIDFFSPDFFHHLNYIVDECARLELDVDLTLGSGWPFGASFITKEMSPDILIPYQQDIIGPKNYSFDFTNIVSGKIIKAILAKVGDGLIVEDSLVDVSSHINTTYIGVWPWGQEINNVEVPEGIYRLYLFVSNEYRQRVGKAAPNMDGYAMDHCRKDVTDIYLEQLGDVLLDNIDSTKIRSVFCDSIELTASNWTKYLLDEFKTRRGYDLTKYMPALWQDVSNISPYIRLDYYKTYGELTVENFFQRIMDYSSKRNIEFRLQAHGTWADIIDAYSASHIPEGETFGFGDILEVNINHHRLAVSASMAKNTKLVSNETYTWLRKPRFLVTLEMMKKATDSCFVDGINHIINHGYSFYKNERFENLFYASSVISPHNSWWNYYPLLSSYIENVSKYLQNSTIKSRVAILTPTTEIWANNPMAELHMSLKIEKHITKEFANDLAKSGYWFSFVNDRRIHESNEYLELANNKMKLLIIPSMNYMNLDTVFKLKDIVNNTKIVFIDCLPKYSDSFIDYKKNNDLLASEIATLLQHENVFNLTKDELLKQISNLVEPDIVITNNENVGYIIRTNEEKEYIFITNISDDGKKVEIKYNFKTPFRIYDALSDSYLTNYQFKDNNIIITLDANQSIIIETSDIFDKLSTGMFYTKELVLSNFDLHIQDDVIKQNTVETWQSYEKHAYFGGMASYKTEFNIEGCKQAQIEIENVHEVCEVVLNNVSVGTIWKKPYTLDISKFIIQGNNKLELKVTNLLYNASLAFEAKMPEGKVSEDWPYLNIVVEQQRKDKVDTFREREENLGLQESGLSGQIKIKYT